MSAAAAPILRRWPALRISVRRSGVLAPLAQLVAFAAMASYAATAYAHLEASAPADRVLAAVGAATLGGAALALTARLRPGRFASALRVAVVVAASLLALGSAGVPARLLWPPGWGELARWLSHGLNGLGGSLWPYRGADPQVRLVVLLGVPACLVPAAALAFWPGAEAARGRRRGAALVMLVTLYIVALVNQRTGAWALQGLALLGLLAAWLWLDRLGQRGSGRALAWLSSCALAAVLLAVLVRAPAPWLDYHSWDPFGPAAPPTSFQWDQLYGPIPWSRSQAPMLEISAATPELWKVTTLDRFDGVGFLRSDTPPATPLGQLRGGVVGFSQLSLTVRGLHSRLLAGAGQVLSAEITASEVAHRARVAPDGTAVAFPAALQPGDTYTVLAYVPHATTAELRRAPAVVPAAYRPFIQFQLPAAGPPRPVDLLAAARPGAGAALTVGPLASWRRPVSATARRRIDASPYARMFALARRLGAGQASAYDVAQRIAGFLRRNYVYDERPPVRPYPLEAFLFQDGVGYCQQFSATMALMLRMDGIPARVAEGFLPGRYDRGAAAYRVTALDAHAWVETYFPGIGWWTFDPTPPRRITAAPLPAVRQRAVDAAAAALGLTPSIAPDSRPKKVRDNPSGAGPVRHRGGGSSAFAPVVLGLLSAIALMSAVLLAAGTLRLRRGLRGDGEGAVQELARALRSLGFVATKDLTLNRLARRLEAGYGPQASRYAQRLDERRFRPDADSPPPTPADRRALRRALVSQGGPWSRLRGLLALPPAIPWPRAEGRHRPG